MYARGAVRADADRSRHAGAGRHLSARIRSTPVTGYAPARTLASSTRRDRPRSALYAFDTVEVELARGRCRAASAWEHYDTDFRAVDAAGAHDHDLEGVRRPGQRQGRRAVPWPPTAATSTLSYGTTVTPPGTANFTLSAQANNQNNPSVEPQESTNFEVGSKWDFVGGRLSLTGAVFRTENENVIFTVDATAIPPIYNQDDGSS